MDMPAFFEHPGLLRSFAEARARGARLDGFGLALKSGVGCETGVEILQCMKPCKAS